MNSKINSLLDDKIGEMDRTLLLQRIVLTRYWPKIGVQHYLFALKWLQVTIFKWIQIR